MSEGYLDGSDRPLTAGGDSPLPVACSGVEVMEQSVSSEGAPQHLAGTLSYPFRPIGTMYSCFSQRQDIFLNINQHT